MIPIEKRDCMGPSAHVHVPSNCRGRLWWWDTPMKPSAGIFQKTNPSIVKATGMWILVTCFGASWYTKCDPWPSSESVNMRPKLPSFHSLLEGSTGGKGLVIWNYIARPSLAIWGSHLHVVRMKHVTDDSPCSPFVVRLV